MAKGLAAGMTDYSPRYRENKHLHKSRARTFYLKDSFLSWLISTDES